MHIEFEKTISTTYTLDGRWLSWSPITLFKKEEKMNFYYVGQKVSHQGFGNGVISLIDSNECFPIMVEFKLHNKSFTIDGRLNKNELPSLSQKPHVPLELEEVISFERGELVWVKFLGDSTWKARYYAEYIEGKHLVFDGQNKSGYKVMPNIIRKFSDNPLL